MNQNKTFAELFEESCERFGLESVELEEDVSKDEVFQEWQEHVNVTASELSRWSQNPCSREASVDPVKVIKRNLRLLEKNKEDWTDEDVEDAQRTISFISRMKAQKPDSPREGPHGCPSEWAISLLNWAYNPFDSIPKPNSEVKEDLEPVDEVTLQERDNIKPADELAEPVWMMKDQLKSFSEEFESYAVELEKTKSEDEVEQIRSELEVLVKLMKRKIERPVSQIVDEDVEMSDSYEFTPVPDQVLYSDRGDAMSRAKDLGLEGVHEHEFGPDAMYMPGDTHRDWVERVKALPDAEEEMSESREASQVFHSKAQGRAEGEDDSSVRVPPVAIHRVDGGKTEVSDDVEEVLERFWEE